MRGLLSQFSLELVALVVVFAGRMYLVWSRRELVSAALNNPGIVGWSGIRLRYSSSVFLNLSTCVASGFGGIVKLRKDSGSWL